MKIKRIICLTLILLMSFLLFSCSTSQKTDENPTPEASEAAEKSGDIYIIYTSDVHCGIDQGFGYAGLAAIRDNLEKQGYTTILVDNGDAIQGEAIGTLSKGDDIIDIMNAVGYDVAIPGNHEFDYTVEHFLELTEKADFQYISCNLNKEGELLFPAYTIVEKEGIKIGFVGVTTPTTLAESTPAFFRNEDGEVIYGFLQDDTGQAVYDAVQEAVDAARADGADYVYVLGHLGMSAAAEPWTYADVIENTNGIDVFLDGHRHDSDQVVMKNKDGDDVVRSACGTKFNGIGYSHISKEDGIVETNIWTWLNETSVPSLMGIENSISQLVAEKNDKLNAELEKVVAKTSFPLTINDPKEVDNSGKPIRMVRRAETNLADFCADACLADVDADIALFNGGGVRVDIEEGDITYGDIISVFPFGNNICVIEATGGQILDALEWGAQAVPDEFGGFIQVAGMSYEIHVSIPSGCQTSEDGLMTGIEGERRVKNVLIGGEPIDPDKKYKVAGADYLLLNHGDGNTAFDGATVLQDKVKLDNQTLIDYIVNNQGGEISTDYSDPYGQGRITIIE